MTGAPVHPFNTWVRATRKWHIAQAIDTLIAKEQATPLDAVETIALALGTAYLDDDLATVQGLAGIFG